MTNKFAGSVIQDAEIEAARKTATIRPTKNQNLLASCKTPHSFQKAVYGISGFPIRWECLKCGGQVSDESRRWYVQGLTHARRESDETYPDLPVNERRKYEQHARVGSTLFPKPDDTNKLL